MILVVTIQLCAKNLKLLPASKMLVGGIVITLSLSDQPLCYFSLSNTRQFHLSRESLWVGKGLTGPICQPLSSSTLSLLDQPLFYFTLSNAS